MRQLLRRFRRHDRGEGLTEYALLIALLAIGLIAILTLARNAIGSSLDRASADVARSSTASYGGAPSPRSSPGPGYGGGQPAGKVSDEPADSAAADSVDLHASVGAPDSW